MIFVVPAFFSLFLSSSFSIGHSTSRIPFLRRGTRPTIGDTRPVFRVFSRMFVPWKKILSMVVASFAGIRPHFPYVLSLFYYTIPRFQCPPRAHDASPTYKSNLLLLETRFIVIFDSMQVNRAAFSSFFLSHRVTRAFLSPLYRFNVDSFLLP